MQKLNCIGSCGSSRKKAASWSRRILSTSKFNSPLPITHGFIQFIIFHGMKKPFISPPSEHCIPFLCPTKTMKLNLHLFALGILIHLDSNGGKKNNRLFCSSASRKTGRENALEILHMHGSRNFQFFSWPSTHPRVHSVHGSVDNQHFSILKSCAPLMYHRSII